MGKTVMKCCGWANGTECPHEGCYVETFDHEAYNGQGYGEFTLDPDAALKFDGMGEALAFWNKVPEARTIRSDGEPNKPMTAMHIELLDLDLATLEGDGYGYRSPAADGGPDGPPDKFH